MSKETRKLAVFFVATFIWTWAFYAPIAVSGNSPYQMPWMILLILGGAGPSIVGVAMVLLTQDKEQRRDYWRRCFSLRRIRLPWWLVIVLIFPATLAVSVAIDTAMGGSPPGMEQLKGLLANPMLWPLVAFLSFLSGPWSEEFGWRGFALDPITKRFGAFPGTVMLGVIWAVLHLPLYFMPATWHGQMGFQLAGFWTFIVFSVALSLIMTWVYTNTNRSILTGMLLHFTSNFTAQLLAPSSARVEILRAILLLLIGVTGLMLMNRRAHARELRAIKKSQPV
jgi:membrane protease YdiL (CAAX protease family)